MFVRQLADRHRARRSPAPLRRRRRHRRESIKYRQLHIVHRAARARVTADTAALPRFLHARARISAAAARLSATALFPATENSTRLMSRYLSWNSKSITYWNIRFLFKGYFFFFFHSIIFPERKSHFFSLYLFEIPKKNKNKNMLYVYLSESFG